MAATRNFFNSRLNDAYCASVDVLTELLNITIYSKLLCQQMHSLLKHKMLQLTLKISLYMASTGFGPFGPSSGSI
jgi:hypothetical protein